jgi:hypothetical protein
LAELIPWNRFLGSLKLEKFGLGIQATIRTLQAGKLTVVVWIADLKRHCPDSTYMSNLGPWEIKGAQA